MTIDESRAMRGIQIVRVTVALLIVIHGIARVSLGIVDDFGLFLAGIGFPIGGVAAWGVTLFEIVGGAALAFGVQARVISIVLAVELAAGIALVHLREGWFVVGAGRNGMEYSVLLIACLIAVAYASSGVRAAELATHRAPDNAAAFYRLVGSPPRNTPRRSCARTPTSP